jgi:hypothetical protein
MIVTHPDQMARQREQENDDPIFKTVSQALWVAYAVEFFKASPKSNMMTILRLAKTKDLRDQENEVKLDGLNFRGMNDEEKVAECVFIRNRVERLPLDEQAYVKARYSWDYDGARKCGMCHMEKLLAPKFCRRDGRYPGYVTWWLFAPYERKIRANPRLIQQKTNLPQDEIYADIKKASRFFNGYKWSAIDLLWPEFEKNGTVEEKS